MPLGLQTAELNFETLKEIGQEGRNSKVFLAHDKQLDGEIVVKVVPKSKLKNASEFYSEAKILYASSHPNVVRVNYGCADNDNIYMAMPYYKNGSLKQLIDTRFLSIREVLRYSIQFLSGLHNIHSKGLLHFDVKPDNILLSDSNEALLSDFGLSKAMDNFGFADPDGIYPKQVPPETFASTQKSVYFDIYLAGLTIYRLLNGNNFYYRQLTYKTQQEYIDAITQGRFPSRDAYLSHIPLKLRRIVNKALNVNLDERYQTVLEMINELGTIDENLDWVYTTTASSEIWISTNESKTYEVILDHSNPKSLKIETYKIIKESGRRTKTNAHCHNNLTTANVQSKLKKAFREL